MEFGISIPNFRGAAHTDTFRRVAGAAEEARLDDVWIGDHIVLARHITSPHPYSSKEKMTGRKPWSEAGIGTWRPQIRSMSPSPCWAFWPP